VLKKLKKTKKKELSFYLHCSRSKNLDILIPYVFKIDISIKTLFILYFSLYQLRDERESYQKGKEREFLVNSVLGKKKY
jgi:hypothetical protein